MLALFMFVNHDSFRIFLFSIFLFLFSIDNLRLRWPEINNSMSCHGIFEYSMRFHNRVASHGTGFKTFKSSRLKLKMETI